MAQGFRRERIADQIRHELSELVAREVHDPGIGFVTFTRVRVSADLQVARAFYTTLGDARARQETARALARATPFLRHQVGQRLRLRRVPTLEFTFDESIEGQDRIERLIIEWHQAEAPGAEPAPAGDTGTDSPDDPDAHDRNRD